MDLSKDDVRLVLEDPADDLSRRLSFQWKGSYLSEALQDQLRKVGVGGPRAQRVAVAARRPSKGGISAFPGGEEGPRRR